MVGLRAACTYRAESEEDNERDASRATSTRDRHLYRGVSLRHYNSALYASWFLRLMMIELEERVDAISSSLELARAHPDLPFRPPLNDHPFFPAISSLQHLG